MGGPNQLLTVTLPACALSVCIGIGGTYFTLNSKSKSGAVADQKPSAQSLEEKQKPEDQKAETKDIPEVADSGLTTIEMMKIDPEKFINKAAKLYVYVKPSDYYNFGYSDARDSHFDFEACEQNGNGTVCANFYIVKSKGRELLNAYMKQNDGRHAGPITIVASNLKFRYETNSSAEFEMLDFKIGEDPDLSVSGYKVPDFLSQMGILVTRIETKWEAHEQSNREMLWTPMVRIYLKNGGDKPLRKLSLEGSFMLPAKNESFGTGTGSLSYNESLEPGQTRFLDVSSSIGYRGDVPYPIPEIMTTLVLNKAELGSVHFTGNELKVTSVKIETLEPVKPEAVAAGGSNSRAPASK